MSLHRTTIARFVLEAGFLVLVAAAVGLAQLGWVWIAVVMFCAWLLVAVVERSESRSAADRRNEGAAIGQLAFAHWATMSADHVADVESFELGRIHDRRRTAAVGDEGVVAGDGDDLAAEQLALLGGLEIQTRFERLGERGFGGFSRLGHGIACYLS